MAILTDFQQRKRAKHAAICREYQELIAEGGQPSAICEYLAAKYNYCALHIWRITREERADRAANKN